MKILLTGDSITDMCRQQDTPFPVFSYGSGYAFFVAGELTRRFPGKYEVFNRGIGGNRSVDLYARLERDCLALRPDLVSVLIGVNDLWHGLSGAGISPAKYERIYCAFLSETREALPDVKFMILQPFVLDGSATRENREYFSGISAYAEIAEKLAAEFSAAFVPLQKAFDEVAEKYGAENWLYDGVHPAVAGAKLISEKWLEAFYGMGL